MVPTRPPSRAPGEPRRRKTPDEIIAARKANVEKLISILGLDDGPQPYKNTRFRLR